MAILKRSIPFVFFYFFFLIVFSPCYFENALPGNTDTIYNLAIFKDYGNRLVAFFTGESIGNALYPAKMMQQYAELYLGEAVIFLFYSIFTNNDVLNYYLFIVTLYALNGWGMFLFVDFLTNKKIPAIVAGFLFSSSAFAFSQIELLNGIPYFFFFLSLISFFKYIEKPKEKLHFLLKATCYAVIQFYFSNYVVLYLLLIVLGFLIIKKNNLFFQIFFYKQIFYSLLIGVLIIMPYMIIADFGKPLMNAHNPLTLDLIPKFSLQISDLWRHLPNHRLYNLPQPPMKNETVRNINFGFLGFGFIIIFLTSLFYLPLKKVKWWILLGLVCFLISLGPIIQWPGGEIKSVIYPLFNKTELYKFMRIPARIYSITIISTIVIIAFFIAHIEQRKRLLFSSFLIVFFYLENVPNKFHLFNADLIKPPQELINFFDDSQEKSNIVVAFFPSSIFTGKPYNEYGVSEFSREYIYSYWQTFLKVNVVNGSSSYIPHFRKELNFNFQCLDFESFKNYKSSSVCFSHIVIVNLEKMQLEGDVNYDFTQSSKENIFVLQDIINN